MMRPEAITIDEGLSQGMIFKILQTRDGFLWIATKDGLNRYDGYNFKVYTHTPADSFSIAENTITALFEDSRGLLWIGTESKGLQVLDRCTGRFYQIRLPLDVDRGNLLFELRSIIETADGSIWVTQMSNGVFRIDLPDDWPDGLPDLPVLDQQVRIQRVSEGIHENFYLLSHLPDGNLLVSSHKQIYRIYRAESRLEAIDLPLPPASLGKDPLTAAFCLPNGDIWASGYDYVLRLRGGKCEFFYFKNVALFSLVWQDGEGNSWLIVERQVWRIDAEKTPDPQRPDFLVDQVVSCALRDRAGNIWLGTYGYGLRKFNLQKTLFHAGAEQISINGVWEDAAGRIYAKNNRMTIFRYDPLTHALADRPAFADAPNRQMDLAFDAAGNYWLLCGVKGEDTRSQLRQYSAEGKLMGIYHFPHNVYNYAAVHYDPAGYLWICGSGGQLLRFDARTHAFTPFDLLPLFSRDAGSVRIVALATDGHGDLWIGTQAGLVRAIKKGETFDFQLFVSDPDNPNSLCRNYVACLLPDPADPSGVIWVGTKGGGLDRFDFRRGEFRHFTEARGLPNNVVYGILADETGGLWCSTNRGIARLDFGSFSQPAESPRVTIYTASEGLQSSEFNTQASWKAPGGALLFGGVNGLNRFLPAQFHFNTPPPPVFIVGLEINHLDMAPGMPGCPFATPLENLRQLQLTYDQNNLSFEFAALDFTDPAKNRYRYRLLELEKDWIEAGTDHFAHYSHLPPGRYTFQVSGSNSNGVWNETPVTIAITVQPPWWRSGAAYLGYFLLLAGAVWWIYRFQLNRVRLREQLAFEHREIRRIRDLEQMKTNFFANVTHEFRTPLTLMLEPLRQLIRNPADPLLVDKLRLVDRGSRRLLDLVNQLLDLARLESGGMGLDLSHGDFPALARHVLDSFEPAAAQKNIRLDWSAPATLPFFSFDVSKVEQILNNLLSNALKFTPEGGTVALALTHEPPYRTVRVTVSDTGIGIPPEVHERIFDRFYQVEGGQQRSGEGSGIGLALSRELARLMGSEITVASQPGQGARFTFELLLTGAADSQPNGAESGEGVSPAEKTGRPIVVIIEDQADLRAFIRQCLGGEWQVEEAPDGASGIQKTLEIVPDLVISDLMMPGKDGYEVCETLKNHELTAHIPVILLTARTAFDAKLRGLRAGADDYLTKPFHAGELLARMNNLVDQRRRLRSRFEQHVADAATAPAASAEEAPALSGPDRLFLQRFVQTIEAHLDDEALGVEDFAGKMFVSRVQLHRKLKGLTGRSATEFIRDYRLERAMTLLKNREGGVGEIAMRVGFGNEKYFSTVFKEKFGVSPSQVA